VNALRLKNAQMAEWRGFDGRRRFAERCWHKINPLSKPVKLTG
jgi:hypothetical protein